MLQKVKKSTKYLKVICCCFFFFLALFTIEWKRIVADSLTSLWSSDAVFEKKEELLVESKTMVSKCKTEILVNCAQSNDSHPFKLHLMVFQLNVRTLSYHMLKPGNNLLL